MIPEYSAAGMSVRTMVLMSIASASDGVVVNERDTALAPALQVEVPASVGFVRST